MKTWDGLSIAILALLSNKATLILAQYVTTVTVSINNNVFCPVETGIEASSGSTGGASVANSASSPATTGGEASGPVSTSGLLTSKGSASSTGSTNGISDASSSLSPATPDGGAVGGLTSASGLESLNGSASSTGSASSSSTKVIPTVVNNGKYHPLGYYPAPADGHLLGALISTSTVMIVELCASDCNQYPYFALENGDECNCGMSAPSGRPFLSPPSGKKRQIRGNGCIPCTGNGNECCGAPGGYALVYHVMPNVDSSAVIQSTTSSIGSLFETSYTSYSSISANSVVASATIGFVYSTTSSVDYVSEASTISYSSLPASSGVAYTSTGLAFNETSSVDSVTKASPTSYSSISGSSTVAYTSTGSDGSVIIEPTTSTLTYDLSTTSNTSSVAESTNYVASSTLMHGSTTGSTSSVTATGPNTFASIPSAVIASSSAPVGDNGFDSSTYPTSSATSLFVTEPTIYPTLSTSTYNNMTGSASSTIKATPTTFIPIILATTATSPTFGVDSSSGFDSSTFSTSSASNPSATEATNDFTLSTSPYEHMNGSASSFIVTTPTILTPIILATTASSSRFGVDSSGGFDSSIYSISLDTGPSIAEPTNPIVPSILMYNSTTGSASAIAFATPTTFVFITSTSFTSSSTFESVDSSRFNHSTYSELTNPITLLTPATVTSVTSSISISTSENGGNSDLSYSAYSVSTISVTVATPTTTASFTLAPIASGSAFGSDNSNHFDHSTYSGLNSFVTVASPNFFTSIISATIASSSASESNSDIGFESSTYSMSSSTGSVTGSIFSPNASSFGPYSNQTLSNQTLSNTSTYSTTKSPSSSSLSELTLSTSAYSPTTILSSSNSPDMSLSNTPNISTTAILRSSNSPEVTLSNTPQFSTTTTRSSSSLSEATLPNNSELSTPTISSSSSSPEVTLSNTLIYSTTSTLGLSSSPEATLSNNPIYSTTTSPSSSSSLEVILSNTPILTSATPSPSSLPEATLFDTPLYSTTALSSSSSSPGAPLSNTPTSNTATPSSSSSLGASSVPSAPGSDSSTTATTKEGTTTTSSGGPEPTIESPTPSCVQAAGYTGNNTKYNDYFGFTYDIRCNLDLKSTPTDHDAYAGSFEECLEYCSLLTDCAAVTYEDPASPPQNSSNCHPKWDFGGYTISSADGVYSGVNGNGPSTGNLENQNLCSSDNYQGSSYDGQTYYDDFAQAWIIGCNNTVAIASSAALYPTITDTLASCVDYCSVYPSCDAVNWLGSHTNDTTNEPNCFPASSNGTAGAADSALGSAYAVLVPS